MDLRSLSSRFAQLVLKKILKTAIGNGINHLYEFAGFEFDGKAGELWRNGKLILHTPKEPELPALLLEHDGKHVSERDL